jgi:sigma-E factor negative regulatory protein RseA
MTDRIKEQLSAFLDGELPDPESALLLKRLERDDDLRGALSRYSLIGAVLRNEGDVPAARQVAARVSAAVAREPAWTRRFTWLPGRVALGRGVAGIAVAAGVALGAVILVQEVLTVEAVAPVAVLARADVPPVQPVSDETGPLDAPAEPYVTPPAAEVSGGIAPAEFANYLVAHYGYASPLVRRSVGAGLISEIDPALADAVPAGDVSKP